MGATYSAFSGLPVPDSGATNDVPYWLSQLVAGLDTQLILTATSTADRDSKFFNAPSGVICVVRSPSAVVSAVYIKTSDVGTSVWSPIWTAPAPLTPQPLILADGVQAANGKAPIAVFNPVPNTWTLYGNVSFINGNPIPNNTIVASLPAAVSLSNVQPQYDGSAATSIVGTGTPTGYAKVSVQPSGNIMILIQSGTAVNWAGFDLITLPAA